MKESDSNQAWHQRIWKGMNYKIPFLDFYAVVLIVFLALMLIPARPWFVELLCNVLDWALLPSAPILIILLLMRKWRGAVLWTVPTIAFFVLFGELFLPGLRSFHVDLSAIDPSATRLKVMTWNLNGDYSADRQPQIDEIRDSGADIIAIQELSQDTSSLIDAKLADIYPYRILKPMEVAGTGLLSKFPIKSQDVFQPAVDSFYFTKAVLDINGVPITVFSAHPPPPISIRELRIHSERYREVTSLL